MMSTVVASKRLVAKYFMSYVNSSVVGVVRRKRSVVQDAAVQVQYVISGLRL